MDVPGKEKSIRTRMVDLVEHRLFHNVTIAVIIINAVTLGLETSQSIMAQWGNLLTLIDRTILGIFVVELLLRLFAYRLAFFRSGWNIFDFVIVVVSLIPAAGNFSVLRSLRILRVLRLLSVIPQLRAVVEALVRGLPAMGAILLVLILVYFVGSVLVTRLYGPSFPEYFGSIGASMFTLFTIMTLEGWAEVARDVMKSHPSAWLFFVPFIVVSAFMVLNLFIAIIVNSMQEIGEAGKKEERDKAAATHGELMLTISALRADIDLLRRELGAPKN